MQIKFIIFLFITSYWFLFCGKKNEFRKTSVWENGYQKSVLFYQNKIVFGEQYDSNGKLKILKSLIGDTILEEVHIGSNGRIISKVDKNLMNKLDGPSYYFYPSGCLKSSRWYKNDTLVNIGRDFYDVSGIQQKFIYYDSLGVYYYYHYYSDTSLASYTYYNNENPRTYLLISKYAPEPTRTNLMKRMEEIGLDSLKQLH